MAGTGAAVWFVAAKLGLPHPITLGLAFTVSSTAVGVALLQVLGLLDRRGGRIAVSLLIVQDLLAVMVLVAISTPAESLTPAGVGVPLLRAALFVIVALVLGATALHRLFLLVLRRASSDLLVVIFSAIALAAAWVGHLAGLTFEFGAFVAGAVTSEAAGSRMVASIVRPFRELFVMLFFVSMGTLVDVSRAGSYWKVLLILAFATIAVRWLLFGGVGRLVRLGAGSAAALGLALLPMGEFNIVLGNANFAAGRLDREEMAVLVGSALISIAASALFARAGESRLPAFDRGKEEGQPLRSGSPVVLVGYGRVGRTVARMLRDNKVEVAVIEREPELGKARSSGWFGRGLWRRKRSSRARARDRSANARRADHLAGHGVQRRGCTLAARAQRHRRHRAGATIGRCATVTRSRSGQRARPRSRGSARVRKRRAARAAQGWMAHRAARVTHAGK